MKAVLAVSGGVDSMVMLDIFIHQTNKHKNSYSPDDIIIAHFDHGIRANSYLDAQFVQQMAQDYDCILRLGKANLGANTSEAAAREQRYKYLHQVAQEFSENGQPAPIFTAHHLDDLVETIIINILRGTGWRGLVGLDAAGIVRPFLASSFSFNDNKTQGPWDKNAILRYAGEHQIKFREDQSNSSNEYLRNRIRRHMNNFPLNPYQIQKIYQLWRRQKVIKTEIDQLLQNLLHDNTEKRPRSWFQSLDANELDRKIALEILRALTLEAGISAARPQLENFRQAIINYQSGKYFNLPNDRLVRLNKDDFSFT